MAGIGGRRIRAGGRSAVAVRQCGDAGCAARRRCDKATVRPGGDAAVRQGVDAAVRRFGESAALPPAQSVRSPLRRRLRPSSGRARAIGATDGRAARAVPPSIASCGRRQAGRAIGATDGRAARAVPPSTADCGRRQAGRGPSTPRMAALCGPCRRQPPTRADCAVRSR